MKVIQVPLRDIIIGERVREGPGDLTELAESMRLRGLINPITVESDQRTLIAGFRRVSSAKVLGWEAIDAQVWTEVDAAELLAVEIEENTAREKLTYAEAEQAWQHYRQLLRVGQPRERDEYGSFTEDANPGVPRIPGLKAVEIAAQATGYSQTTLQRVQQIRETAESETEPEPVREVAQQEYEKLKTTKGKGAHGAGPTPALERVKEAKRLALARTRAAMLPGQVLDSDVPRPKPPPQTYEDRLWKLITAASGGVLLTKFANELTAATEEDLADISDDNLTRMARMLQDLISDRQRLHKALLQVKRQRKEAKKT